MEASLHFVNTPYLTLSDENVRNCLQRSLQESNGTARDLYTYNALYVTVRCFLKTLFLLREIPALASI